LILAGLLVVALIAGAAVISYGIRDQDPRRPEFYERVLGTPLLPTVEHAACSNQSIVDLDGSGFYALVLPSPATEPAGENLPAPAEFQEAHTLVNWHSPTTAADLQRISPTLRTVKASLAGSCPPSELNRFSDLEHALSIPTTHVAYSYLEDSGRLYVLEFYAFDPVAGAFYVVRFSV
jgi:hypothetical protein